MSKPSILIVDDELKFISSLSILLGRDFQAFTVTNGPEALTIIDNKPISLVLLDLNMPGMNGTEVLERIRSKSTSIKVMIMTGERSYDWAKRCADLGVQGYIEKPFEYEELLKKIRYILAIEDYGALRNFLGMNYDAKMSLIGATVKSALRYIDRNLHKKITRIEVALHLGISPEYLSRLFQRECGLGLKDYIDMCRIEKSTKHLMNSPHLSMEKIAESVGMNNVNYFYKFFKKHSGITPLEFIKNQKNS